MIYTILEKVDKWIPFGRVKAHCDIPCGIYDPISAQIAALTVVRMVDLMAKLNEEHPTQDVSYHNTMSRYIASKEEHAEKCKHEVRIIMGDYMKPEHVEKFPDLIGLVQKIMKLGSESRQKSDRDTAMSLLKAVNDFADIYWQTKGIKVKKASSPYAIKEELVYPAL